MKLTITLVSLLIVTAGPVLADEVLVSSPRTAPAPQLVNRAFGTCANAFVAQVLPGQDVNIRTELNIRRYTNIAYHTLEVGGGDIAFTMQVRLKRDNSTLATGSCTVSRDEQVSVSVRTAPAAKLEGLTPNDIKLAMVSR